MTLLLPRLGLQQETKCWTEQKILWPTNLPWLLVHERVHSWRCLKRQLRLWVGCWAMTENRTQSWGLFGLLVLMPGMACQLCLFSLPQSFLSEAEGIRIALDAPCLDIQHGVNQDFLSLSSSFTCCAACKEQGYMSMWVAQALFFILNLGAGGMLGGRDCE